MPVTLIVEPDPGGHRLQLAAVVARYAARTSEVVLLTSRGAVADRAYQVHLADLAIKTHEVFDDIYPPTRQIAREVAERCRTEDVGTVVVMDADQSLKRWWYVAAREFRSLPRRPRVVFMLTRYPARLGLRDRFGWELRVSKAALALAAMATGTLHRVAGFAGRDETRRGWLVRRALDPAVCSAHSRDRARLRAELGLPADRRLAGIFGVITPRKNAAFVLEAIIAGGVDADLVLAGQIHPEVQQWLDELPGDRRQRVHEFPGFLSDERFDKLVACVDVAPVVLTNNGPSGTMGKALAAEVPVLTAGSVVRAREVRATGGGIATELDVAAVARGLGALLTEPFIVPPGAVAAATEDAFAATLLGTSD